MFYNKAKTNMAVIFLKNSMMSTVQVPDLATADSKNVLKQITTQVCYFFISLFVSRSTIFELYAPFGPAFVVAVPYKNLWAAMCGSIIGYILPLNINGSMRYISTAIAVAAIRWTLSDLSKIHNHPIYYSATAFIPTFATGFAMNTVDGLTLHAITISFVEAVLCAAIAYFFYRSIDISCSIKKMCSLSQVEFTCFFITCSIIALSFSSVSIGFISLGRAIIIISILLCSKFAGISGGSIAGICSGVLFSLASNSFLFISGAYAFGGLMSGLFSSFGKFFTCVAFISTSTIISLTAEDPSTIITCFYESILASIIFMLIPEKILNVIAKIFYRPQDNQKSEGLRRSVIMRLNFIGKSLCSVADSVDSVSEKLEKLNSPNASSIYNQVVENVCKRCGMKSFCWNREVESTTEVFKEINSKILQTQIVKPEDFREEFIRRCCKIGEVTSEMNKNYEEFQTVEMSRRRVNEIRSVVSDQFAGMGEILFNMAKEFDKFEHFDLVLSKKISQALRAKNILTIDSVCRIDRYGRMCIEVETAGGNKKLFEDIGIPKLFGDIAGRTFDIPSIINTPDRCRIQVSEKPMYSVKIGSFQHICNDGTLCGDSYSFFNDGSGRMIVILSDGMGTGGRAAVDGAMASDIMARLSKAGLDFESALKIVNSSLLVKSSDESLATVDIVCIDLFSGDVEIIKAGAPLTLVRNKNKVTRFDTSSLPTGILMDVKFARECTKVTSDDWIVMVSDGALALGEEFLESELSNWDNDDPQKFATHLVNNIIKNRSDGYDDDITAVTMHITLI